MNLTQNDINELLAVLHTALSEARLRDMSAQARQRDLHGWPFTQEEMNTYRAYMDTISKWIHLFSQQVGVQLESEED